MGYISEHSRSINTNALDSDIVHILYHRVKQDCISLIENSYLNYLKDRDKVFSPDETVITAGIYDHIDKIICDNDLPFIIVPEFHQYTNLIKKGKANPNTAKRFDLLFTNFQYTPRIKFGVEAKLLAETNTPTKNANTLISEYVEDAGMGKFLKKIYENDGFMLGYVLNGTIKTLVDKINTKIANTYSVREHLIVDNKHYKSAYSLAGQSKELYHIFLKFSASAN